MSMKQTITLIAVLTILFSCQKAEIFEPGKGENGDVCTALTLKAVYEADDDASSKVEMANNGLSMYFEEGDRIGVSVFGPETSLTDIPYSAANITTEGCDFLTEAWLNFKVKDGDIVYAVYPYEKELIGPDLPIENWDEQTYTGGVEADLGLDIEDWESSSPITKTATGAATSKVINVAAEQTMPKANDFTALDKYIHLSAAPTEVEMASATLVFSPVTAQVRIQLQNESGSAMTINKATLATTSEPNTALTGNFELDLTASPQVDNADFALAPIAGNTSNTVTLNFESPITLAAGARTELYFVVNAFNASSLTLSVFTDTGKHVIKRTFADDKRAFTRKTRRHIAFPATSSTFISNSSLEDLGFTPHVDGEMYNTYKGLVMAGYQGWHNCPGDGGLCGQREGMDKWAHYSSTADPLLYDEEGNVMPYRFERGAMNNAFTFWPDCSEYTYTYAAPGFTYPDGTQAELFSSYDEQTVMTHFRWMKEYGIDGVFAQRFMVYVNKNNSAEYADHMVNLDHQMKASNEYGRAIAIMYDLIGMNAEPHLTPEYLMADLAELEAKYKFKDRSEGQKYYLYHNGKPLIGLVSFAQINMIYDMEDCRKCVELLQEAGYSVMIGVPTYWRAGGNDIAEADRTALLTMIDELKPDVIMPWTVGRYDYDGTTKPILDSDGKATSFDDFCSSLTDDAAYCKARGIDFAPNIWPGFDWSHQRPRERPYDRHGGDFLWKQAYHNIATAGAEMIYVAMFDEVDEGTAIFKTLRKSDAPSNTPGQDFYIKYNNDVYTLSSSGPTTTDLLPSIFGGGWNRGPDKWWYSSSVLAPTFNGVEDEYETDHYLWLTGQIRAMLRRDIPMTETRPTR